LVIDLGVEQDLSGVRLLPRQDSANGRIKDYKLYLSLAPF
jgi:beta-galactosidase